MFLLKSLPCKNYSRIEIRLPFKDQWCIFLFCIDNTWLLSSLEWWIIVARYYFYTKRLSLVTEGKNVKFEEVHIHSTSSLEVDTVDFCHIQLFTLHQSRRCSEQLYHSRYPYSPYFPTFYLTCVRRTLYVFPSLILDCKVWSAGSKSNSYLALMSRTDLGCS